MREEHKCVQHANSHEHIITVGKGVAVNNCTAMRNEFKRD
jgi:hypothetical protein